MTMSTKHTHTHVSDNEAQQRVITQIAEAKVAISGLREKATRTKTRTKQVPKGKCPPTIAFKRTLQTHSPTLI